jgi:SAM-dependent methyltransferase
MSDPDAYAARTAAELAFYQNCENVHDLPAIFHYWSNKYLKPKFDALNVRGMNEFFEDQLYAAAMRTGVRDARFLSIGSGNCDIEVELAVALRKRGLQRFSIECLELNPGMLARGAELARQKQVGDCLVFTQTDFNAWSPARPYCAAMANQSLHHVLNLEHLFDAVQAALMPRGLFAVSDMIGRNGHMRWPEALAIVHELWVQMPPRYRYNMLLQRHEDLYENWDCSKDGFEGVRAQDILPLLVERFRFELFLPFANVVDVFIDRAFGHHFSPEGEWDTFFVDRVQARDEQGIASGELTPTHMLAVLSNDSPAPPLLLGGLTPERCIRRP